jgi:hypothetical protein
MIAHSHTAHAILLHRLALKWKGRREAQGLKPGTKKHAEAQLHFFIGAMGALELVAPNQQLNPGVLLLLATGRDAAVECVRPDLPQEYPDNA